MNKEEFLEKLQDILGREDRLTESMLLRDIEEWDSLAAIGVMSFFNQELEIDIKPQDIRQLSSVQDLINKAGL